MLSFQFDLGSKCFWYVWINILLFSLMTLYLSSSFCVTLADSVCHGMSVLITLPTSVPSRRFDVDFRRKYDDLNFFSSINQIVFPSKSVSFHCCRQIKETDRVALVVIVIWYLHSSIYITVRTIVQTCVATNLIYLHSIERCCIGEKNYQYSWKLLVNNNVEGRNGRECQCGRMIIWKENGLKESLVRIPGSPIERLPLKRWVVYFWPLPSSVFFQSYYSYGWNDLLSKILYEH